MVSPVNTLDAFFWKLTESGETVWIRQAKTTSNASVDGIHVDDSGNVYGTGFYFGNASLEAGSGSSPLPNATSQDIFVWKLDAGGHTLWAVNAGGSTSETGRSVATDAAGNVYAVGFFRGTAGFAGRDGTVNVTSQGNGDVFVWKLDASGNTAWLKTGGGTAFDKPYGVVVDDANDLDPSADSFLVPTNGGYDIFVAFIQEPDAPTTMTYVVDENSDLDDGNQGTGQLSLREAITLANGNAGVDTITFNFGGAATITLGGTALPEITDSVQILGLGADSLTVDGDNSTSILSIASDTTVSILGIMLTRGNSSTSGGAISNAGNLTLIESVLSHSKAVDAGGQPLKHGQVGGVEKHHSRWSGEWKL